MSETESSADDVSAALLVPKRYHAKNVVDIITSKMRCSMMTPTPDPELLVAALFSDGDAADTLTDILFSLN